MVNVSEEKTGEVGGRDDGTVVEVVEERAYVGRVRR